MSDPFAELKDRVSALEERTSELDKTTSLLHATMTERATALDFRFKAITDTLLDVKKVLSDAKDSQVWAQRLAASTLLSVIITGVLLAFKG